MPSAPSIDAVVVGQRQRQHAAAARTGRLLVVDRLHPRARDAEDRDFRRVDDRREVGAADAAEIRDAEAAALHLLERDLARRAPSPTAARARPTSCTMFFVSASRMTGTSRPRSVSTATPMLTYFLRMISLGRHVDRRVELREHLQRRRDDLHRDRRHRQVAAGGLRPASRTSCAAPRAPVMSARSCCVTCGIVAHAALRCSAVLRRTARIGCRSTSPQREKSGSGSARRRAAAAPRRSTSRLACAFTSSIEIRPSGAAAGTSFDVDAELARHAAHRRRRRRRRQFRRRGGRCRRSAPAAPRLMSTTFLRARARRRPRRRTAPADRPPDPSRRPCRGVVDLIPGLDVRLRRRGSSSFAGSRRPAPHPPRSLWPSAFAGSRLRRRLPSRAPTSAASARRFARSAAVLDAQDRLADLDLVAGLDLDLLHLAGDRRRHFDRRLVGFELEDRLIFRDACRRA